MRVAKFQALILCITSAIFFVETTYGGTTVSVSPENLTLCPGESKENQGHVLVTVQNDESAPLSNACLSTIVNGPIKISIPKSKTRNDSRNKSCAELGGAWAEKINANSTFAVLANIGLAEYTATDSTLYFRVDYECQKDNSKTQVTSISKPLTVKAPTIPEPEKFKIEVIHDNNTLHEEDSKRFAIKISNYTNDLLVLEKLTESDPNNNLANENNYLQFFTNLLFLDKDRNNNERSIKIERQVFDIPMKLPPNSSSVIEYEIKTAKKIFPGKYTVLIAVEAKNRCGASILQRVIPYNFELSIFGQSDILPSEFGAPSLLLLPGFLALTVCMLLWRFQTIQASLLTKYEDGKKEFILSAKDPEFWLISVTISLFAFLFTRFEAFGYNHPYSLTDISILWSISILVGGGFYFVLLCLSRERDLKPTHGVDEALDRLQKRRLNLNDCKPVTIGQSQENWFQLWDDDAGSDKAWVISPINCKVKDRPKDYTGEVSKLNLENLKDVKELLNALRKAHEDGWIEYKWANDHRPALLNKDLLNQANKNIKFVNVIYPGDD